jgi:hypothetical protein
MTEDEQTIGSSEVAAAWMTAAAKPLHFHTPGRTRTFDPLLRRQMLYPPELRARDDH